MVENKNEIQKWGFVAEETFSTIANKWRELTSYQMPDTGDEDVNKLFDRLQWEQSFFNERALWGDNSPWSEMFLRLPRDIAGSLGILSRAEERQKAYNDELKETGKATSEAAEGLEDLSDAQKESGDVLSQYGAQRVKEFKDELADLRVELEFSGDEYRKSRAQLDLWKNRESIYKNYLSEGERAVIDELYSAKLEQIEKEHRDKISEAIQTNFDNAADIEFEMTHTAFEKQIRDIERWEQAQLEKRAVGEETADIIAAAAAKEAQAFEDEMDRIRGKLQSLDDKIFDIDHSQYEKDLRRIQQDYFKQAQEYQDMGAFTPEVKAKLDYLYLRQKQDIDKRAYESRTNGGDYTKAPEGIMQPYGGGLPIGLFADTSGIEALLYSKLDADAQNEVNKIRGIENLAPAEQELKQLGETVRKTVDDFQSFEDLKSTLKEAADTQKTLDDRIKILTESTSKLAEAQNDFVGTLKNLSFDDSPQSKYVTAGKSIFAQKLKDFAWRISETPPNAENGVPKIPNSTQKVSDAQYYTFPISVDLDRRLREILGIPLPESISHKGVFATNENLKAMPADVDLSTLETSLSGIGENVQSILQSIQAEKPQEADRLQELFGALPNIEEYLKSVLLEMQSEETETDLSEYFSVMPKISEDVQSKTAKEIPDAPALQQLQMPEPNAALVDYLTPLNNIDGKLQSILQATQMRETISFETVITPLNSINALVWNILTALSNRKPPQITVSPNNSINLGGAYVFDNALKQELVNDITSNGVLAATVNKSLAAKNFIALTHGWGTKCTNYFTGSIDEFLLFDGVALHTENFTPPTAADYAALAFQLDSHVSFTVDVQRKLISAVEVSFDVQRKVKQKWRYVNAGTADSLIVTGTTLNNLPESKSKTGIAFYQTTRAKCFDLPATDEIWLKFDVYFNGSNRWRAYNGGSNGTTGATAQTNGDFNVWINDANNGATSNICVANQLRTVLLHMVSGSSDGIVEAWVDGEKVYSYTGDVNHGQDFAVFYLYSGGAGTFFSNVIISNAELTFGDGYHSISFDIERKISTASVDFTFDVERNLIEPIIIPPIGEHFNHLIKQYAGNYFTIWQGGAQKFILPKKSKVYVRGEDTGAVRIFSDTDPVGKITGSGRSYTGKFYAELDECEEFFIEMAQTTTPQQVIKAFMFSLKKTTLSGTAALDKAINFATGGTIPDINTLTSNFLRDLNSSASYTDFLRDYCDIILDNLDTGAITGLDAGGSLEKTAQSVVREKTPIEHWEMPEAGTSTVINGLTVRWPTSGVNGDFSDAEKFILKGLNSEWIARSLELIYDTYEISFYDYRIAIREISVNFENNNNDVLAYVNYKQNSSGSCTELSLLINMRFYSAINQSSEDGFASTTGAFYLDRTLAHELTHGIMAALLNPLMNNLPKYILEGTAELVHGIDDTRRNTIVQLLTTRTADLERVFSTGSSDSTDHYAAGYMLLRYLAKQGRYSIDSRYGNYVSAGRINYLLISDGATLYDGMTYEALTDNTRQNFYPDISRNLVRTLEDDFDISISNVIQVELLADIKRALLADVNLFARDRDAFFSDESNPFVNPSSGTPAASYSPPVSADLPVNTQGLQNFEVELAEQQLTDQLRFTAVIPFDIMQQVKGQYLDYPYNMRVERVQQQGILYSCECCSDVDQLLYTQMAYKIPATTTWYKVDGEEVGGTPKTVEIQTVYPAASTHVNQIANALHLSPVMQFDNFLSTVLMDEQGGVTYNDLIRDIFGWSSRIPTMLINVIIRDGKLFVIQRGHESHSVDISNAKMTVPVITKELVRTTWGSTLWSKTSTQEWESQYFVPADVVVDSSQGGDEKFREVLSQFSGNGTQGNTTYKYDEAGRLIQTYTYVRDNNRGGQNTYTTVNNYYDKDGTMIRTETFTQSMDGSDGQSASKSTDEKYYITLPNGEKFLSQEVTKRWQNDSGLSITDNDLVDSRVTVHHPSRVGQSHVVTVSMDGEVVGEAGGQNTGDDRVTPFRNKKAADFANSFDSSTGEWKTQTQETGMRLCQRFCVNSKPPKNANFW